MKTHKIGSQDHLPMEPNKFQSEMPEGEFQVKKTHLKDNNIPSVTSRQLEFPHSQIVEHAIELVEPEQPSNNPDIEIVEQQMEIVEALSDQPTKSVISIAYERMYNELERLMKKEDTTKTLEEKVKAVLGTIQVPVEILHTFATHPYQHAEPFITLTEDIKGSIQTIVSPIEKTRTLLQGVELLGNGAALIVLSVHCQAVKKLFKEIEMQLEQDPLNEQLGIYVTEMRNYLDDLEESLNEKIVSFSASFSTVGLKTSYYILSATEQVAAFAKHSVGWSLTFLDVLWESISLWRAQKAETTHEAWMIQIAKDQRTFQQAEDLLVKRQERMILSKAEKLTFEELSATLREKGIHFEGKNSAAFKFQLSDPVFRKEIMDKFIDANDTKEDTINVMTRNAIQSLAEVKIRNEKKFFDFKLTKSKFGLSLACISSALTIALEVLAITGVIAVAASTLALPGLGFFIFGATMTGVGLFFFYKYKPNLFKCFLKGVNLRLAFYKIPAKIRSLQLHRKKYEIKVLEITSARYEELEGLLRKKETLNKPFPKEFRHVLEKLRKDIDKKIDEFEGLDEKAQLQLIEEVKNKKDSYIKKIEAARKREDELIEKVDSWVGEEGKITKLQEKLIEAGNKDFAIANRLVSTAQNENMNIPMIIVEKIFDANFDFDNETLKILREKMGINLMEIPLRLGEADKEELIKKLKKFFKMDDEDLLAFMKKQLKALKTEKYGKLPEGKAA